MATCAAPNRACLPIDTEEFRRRSTEKLDPVLCA